MNNLIMIFLFISLKAYSTESCNFKDSTVISDIEKYKPSLSEPEVVKLAENVTKRKKISIPNDWCRDISLKKENGKLTWDVFYSGNELDACFSVFINDKTRKSYLEYCS